MRTLLIALLAAVTGAQTDALRNSQEKHLRNIRQITFGGQNAECYWSHDGKWLILQSSDSPNGADQVYLIRPDGSGRKMISTGTGRCTCAYVFPGSKRVLFASTHAADPKAPPPADMSKGYYWPMHKTYEIFTADMDGKNLKQITRFGNYTAEGTVNPKGRIVFTSLKDGDLDIYTMDKNGKNVKRLTDSPGYDGGPFWSYDGKLIAYRRSAFTTQKELDDYRANLKENIYRPGPLEIWVMDPEGRNKRQITHLGASSFAPFLSPDNKRIIFSSNYGDPKGREFDLYMINLDGTGLERITYSEQFDGFPMFSPDGKKLVFASNRHGAQPHETNIFVADWVP